MALKQIPIKELNFSFAKSSGPGGQKVNKVNTKATMTWNILKTTVYSEALKKRFIDKYKSRVDSEGGIQISSQRYRTQPQNIADCIGKLFEMLKTVERPPKVRRKTKPSKSSISKNMKKNKGRSELKKSRQKIRY